MKQKKVLIVATTPLRNDGLTSVLIRLAEITADYYSLSFALAESITDMVYEKLSKLGSIYELPSRKQSLIDYYFALSKLAKGSSDEHFDIVHIHGNSATMALDLMAVRNIPCRITHVHNCAKQPKLKQMTLGRIMNKLVTKPAACSEASGRMMYTKQFSVLTNGIDCNRFKYSEERRNEIRKQLRLNKDSLVIGHIGYFNKQKNQERLIQIFQELLKRSPDAKLILCGSGELLDACRSYAKESEANTSILFVPETNNPEHLYSAMDVFVMPSLFEGLPLAGIEAQANGLPCVFSDTITQEVQVLENCRFISLYTSNQEWVRNIIEITQRPVDRIKMAEIMATAGYDAEATKGQVLELYG